MGSYALGDLSGSDSLDSIDLSTVDPNPSVDQSVQGTDGGAASFSDIANVVGKWGVTIGSVLTNTPIVAAQTTTGGIVPVGARGSTVAGAGMSSFAKLAIIGLVIVGVWYIAKKG